MFYAVEKKNGFLVRNRRITREWKNKNDGAEGVNDEYQ